jgi:hypothetical protein
MFAVLFSNWYYDQSIAGYATPQILPTQFQLIWGQENQHTSIELWLYAKQGNSFSTQSRLYTMPWSMKMAQTLSSAKKSLADGIPVFMGKPNQGKSGKKSSGGMFGKFKGKVVSAISQIYNGMNSSGDELQIIKNPIDEPTK